MLKTKCQKYERTVTDAQKDDRNSLKSVSQEVLHHKKANGIKLMSLCKEHHHPVCNTGTVPVNNTRTENFPIQENYRKKKDF